MRFHYLASADKLETRGVITATSRQEAVKRLKDRGYQQIRVRRAEGDTGKFFQRFFGTA